MPDTNRLPRIGEIWAEKESGKRVLVLVNRDDTICIYTDNLCVTWVCTDYFVDAYVPTGTEYDLDPLVLALKGDRT